MAVTGSNKGPEGSVLEQAEVMKAGEAPYIVSKHQAQGKDTQRKAQKT